MMNGYNEATATRSIEFTMPGLMRDVYVWMMIALSITGFTAYMVSTTPFLLRLVVGSQIGMWGFLIATIALVWHLSARVDRMSLKTATTMFLLYSILNGFTMAAIFIVYTMSSIAGVFLVTAGTFGAMSVYGYATKTDLSRIGNICLMALLGLIIATVVNFFLQSSIFDLIAAYVGVLIFVGLTAADTQKIRRMAETHDTGATDAGQKMAIMGALTLYLDFINLFLYLLRIFGNRK